MEYRCVPNCVFTNPEIATVGAYEGTGRQRRQGDKDR